VTAEHDLLRDLVAPVALGAADPSEVARVEAHAAGCAVCREELAALRAGADVLAVAVPQVDPPDDLKRSLMETVRAEAPERQAAAGVTGRHAVPAPPARSRRRVPAGWRARLRPWPVTAVVASIAALLLGWNIALQTRGGDHPDVTTLSVSGTADAPRISGRVVYVPDEDTAVVSLDRLPPLRAGEAYQLWVIRRGTPTSAGLLEPTGPSAARRAITGVRGADALAVTAQPIADRAMPEGPILVQAPLTTT
jgi:anti-sigma-K factor RskA